LCDLNPGAHFLNAENAPQQEHDRDSYDDENDTHDCSVPQRRPRVTVLPDAAAQLHERRWLDRLGCVEAEHLAGELPGTLEIAVDDRGRDCS
jgi:hypothetical protein